MTTAETTSGNLGMLLEAQGKKDKFPCFSALPWCSLIATSTFCLPDNVGRVTFLGMFSEGMATLEFLNKLYASKKLSLMVLLYQNTTSWVTYKVQKFNSHSLVSLASSEGEEPYILTRQEAEVWIAEGRESSP